MVTSRREFPTVSDQLRNIIASSPRTMYRIVTDGGVDYLQLHRFMAGSGWLAIDTVDVIGQLLRLRFVVDEGHLCERPACPACPSCWYLLSDQLRNIVLNSPVTRFRIATDSGVDQMQLRRFVRRVGRLTTDSLDAVGKSMQLRLVVEEPTNAR